MKGFMKARRECSTLYKGVKFRSAFRIIQSLKCLSFV